MNTIQKIVIIVTFIYVNSILFSPYCLWKSYLRIWISVLFENHGTIGIKTRLFHISFLLKDVALLPLWTLFWYLDELIFPGYRKIKIKGILLIVGQPRSGTTILHRTISKDYENFIGIRHYEWRYPFLCFDKLIRILGIKTWFENRNYWGSNKPGQIASLMHPHKLRDFEEDGIFFEERFWHHYFIFRRFPYPSMMPYIASYSESSLSLKERTKMMKMHEKVIRKVIYQKEDPDKYVLLKENESIDLIRLYINYYPVIGLIGIVRPSSEIIKSYDALSRFSSMAKGNPDPIIVPNWRKINLAHREREFREMCTFLTQRNKIATFSIVTVSFHFATHAIKHSVEYIYSTLNIALSNKFISHLMELNKSQHRRKREYALHDIEVEIDCALFDEWVKTVEQQMLILEKSIFGAYSVCQEECDDID